MIRKFEVGMKLEIQNGAQRVNVIVTDVPEDANEKLTVAFEKSGKERKISREALKTATRVKEVKEKRPSVVSTAIQILVDKNVPMTIKQITECLPEYGYTQPREGKTLANSVSSRMNGAAKEGKCKKLANGVFAANECTVEYVKPETAASKRAKEAEAKKEAVAKELAEAFAEA